MSPCGGAADDVTYPIVPSSPGRRSILQIRREPPTEPNTKLVVDRDGKVFLKQQPKETPYWSFSTGSPMHSLYQAPANNNTENATEITRPHIIVEYLNNSKAATTVDGYHNWTVQEFFRQKPLVTDDGVTLGSETTSAYLVDGRSGRLIHVYKSTGDTKITNALVKPASTEDFVNEPLLIRRTDSKLEHFSKTTGKLVWNLTVSHFRAALLCDPVFNSGYDLGPKLQTGIYMPLLCGSQIDVRGPEIVIRVLHDQPMNVKMLPSPSLNHFESEDRKSVV